MPGRKQERWPMQALRIPQLAYRPVSTGAISRKGLFMLRGLISSKLAVLVLLAAAVAAAQQPATQTAAEPADEGQQKVTHTETVVVTAPGEYRDQQQLEAPTLLQEAPGTSPIKSLEQLPSVNFQTADPYGSYEWAVRITVRGFYQNQLGFTLDDVPLGDMSYGNWNGLHISRAIMDENLGRVVLSQGTGALETASNSNLGGTVQFYSVDPSEKRSFTVDQAFGSFKGSRTVARFESGLIGGKTKFYLAAVRQNADKWKGNGDISQNYWQFNSKLVHYFGSKGVLTGFLNVSDRREVDYLDVSKAYVNTIGYDADNYGIWSNATQAANACAGDYGYAPPSDYPGSVNNLDRATQDPCDAGYYGGGGLRRDIIGGVSYKAALTDKLTWKSTVYGHGDDGIGLWFAPTAEFSQAFYYGILAMTGSPIAMRSSEYGIQRGGFLTSLSYETNRNKLEGGAWFEKENFTLGRRFYPTSANYPIQSLSSFPSNPFYTQWAYDFNIKVFQVHLQDQYKVNNKFTLSAGFKTVETYDDGKLDAFDTPAFAGSAASDFAQGSLTSGKPFLPQFGGNYRIDKNSELFGDAAYNVQAYEAGGNGFNNAPWGTNQIGFNSLQNTLKPETSWTEEGGYRYTAKKATAQVNYFHVNFSNRLLALAQGAGIVGNPSLLTNVGGVTTNGVDAAATVPLGDSGFAIYNGLTYSHSTYDSDVTTYPTVGGVVVPTTYSIKGKIALDSPEFLYKTQLSYSKKGLFSNISADYMSKRYYSYDNTGSVDGRFLANLAAGYQREEIGVFQDFKLQLNISNLISNKYYSTIDSNGTPVSDATGVWDTLQVGPPRAFVGTLSVRF
jgi:iron complex outermembrane receptor protein